MSTAEAALLDRFVPQYDVRGRHEIIVGAPASLVMEVARNFEIESLFIVRTLFRLRGILLGIHEQPPQEKRGLIDQMLALGWGCLAEDRNRFFIAGAACRPWQAQPGFASVAAEQFADFAEPDLVKIAWTLEAVPLASASTRFATETRAVATDKIARTKFRWYWRKFGAGIVLIRLVVLPALRRQAERQWRTQARAA